MIRVCFATNNQHKIKEMSALLGSSFLLAGLADVGCHEELPETQPTIEGNSLQKAQYVLDHYGVACFADDTGLEVDALHGAPGVYSARYAGEHKNSNDNIDLLLQNLRGVTSRGAQFKTVITFVEKDAVYAFEGIVRGSILDTRKGTDGFGYDPVFVPDGYDRTFAEMTLDEKNKISHRGIAVRKLIAFLQEKYRS